MNDTTIEQVRDPDIASKHLGDLVCNELAVNQLKPERITEKNYTECFWHWLGDSRHKVGIYTIHLFDSPRRGTVKNGPSDAVWTTR